MDCWIILFGWYKFLQIWDLLLVLKMLNLTNEVHEITLSTKHGLERSSVSKMYITIWSKSKIYMSFGILLLRTLTNFGIKGLSMRKSFTILIIRNLNSYSK